MQAKTTKAFVLRFRLDFLLSVEIGQDACNFISLGAGHMLCHCNNGIHDNIRVCAHQTAETKTRRTIVQISICKNSVTVLYIIHCFNKTGLCSH